MSRNFCRNLDLNRWFPIRYPHVPMATVTCTPSVVIKFIYLPNQFRTRLSSIYPCPSKPDSTSIAHDTHELRTHVSRRHQSWKRQLMCRLRRKYATPHHVTMGSWPRLYCHLAHDCTLFTGFHFCHQCCLSCPCYVSEKAPPVSSCFVHACRNYSQFPWRPPKVIETEIYVWNLLADQLPERWLQIDLVMWLVWWNDWLCFVQINMSHLCFIKDLNVNQVHKQNLKIWLKIYLTFKC